MNSALGNHRRRHGPALSALALSGIGASELAAKRDLLVRVRAAAVQRYGRPALDALDLPELSTGSIDAELLRVAAVLLWARYVEEAGIPRFVEALAQGVRSGRLLLAIGSAGDALGRYWQGRQQRFTAQERNELYARLFGGSGSTDPNSGFFSQLSQLAMELSTMARVPDDRAVLHHAIRASSVARVLASTLSERSAGMATYAAEEIVAHIESALQILRLPELVTALGGQGVWATVRSHAPAVLGTTLDPATSLARARAGHSLLLWIAEHSHAIEAGQAAVARGDPVLAAAEQWRAAEAGS